MQLDCSREASRLAGADAVKTDDTRRIRPGTLHICAFTRQFTVAVSTICIQLKTDDTVSATGRNQEQLRPKPKLGRNHKFGQFRRRNRNRNRNSVGL